MLRYDAFPVLGRRVRYDLEYLDAYDVALARLDNSPETGAAIKRLIELVTYFPDSIPMITGDFMRTVITTSAGGYRPLRLFYWIDGKDVIVIHIEAYDELEL